MKGRGTSIQVPDRLLVEQIERIPGCTASINGTFLTGTIEKVFVGAGANDGSVRLLTELDGLDGLDALFIVKVRLKAATAIRIARFKNLSFLFLNQTGIADEILEKLMCDLPNCRIETR